jgi:hypothetical protein
MRRKKYSLPEGSLATRWRSSMAKFLAVELHTAEMFVSMAMKHCSPENKARYVQNARKAYDTVVHFALRTPLTPREVAHVAEKLESLRSSLAHLGETDFAAMPVSGLTVTASAAEKLGRAPAGKASVYAPQLIKLVARRARRFEMRCRQLCSDCRKMLAQNRALMQANPLNRRQPLRASPARLARRRKARPF